MTLTKANTYLDKVKGFVTCSALHIVNQASVDSLKQSYLDKYKDSNEELNDFSHLLFRPNMVVAMPEPFLEDTVMEARINNTMVHQRAPCVRCKVLTADINRCRLDPNMEPYMTISKLRQHRQYGILFGIYAFVNTISSENHFKQLLPAFSPKGIVFDSRKVEIRVGDTFKIRVFKKEY